MRRIKVAIASVGTTVGAIDSNTNTAIKFAHEMGKAGCAVGVFQEQLFGGYPAEDLIQASEFVSQQFTALQQFAIALRTYNTVFVVGIAVHHNGFPYNACAVVHSGRILGIVPKEDLPGYGVFDEPRVFSRGVPGTYGLINGVPFGDLVFKFPFGAMATFVCEETWTPEGPLSRRSVLAELAAVINSSPNRVGVLDTRKQMLATRSADYECALVAAYQVGGNDSLAFDGGGFCFQNGQLIGEAQRFVEGVTVFEIDLQRTERMRKQNSTWRTRNEAYQKREDGPRVIEVPDGPECLDGFPSREFAERFDFLPANPVKREEAFDDIVETIIMGLDGYYKKSGAFEGLDISLSGGWDSALTLILAKLWADRQGKELSDIARRAHVAKLVSCYSQPTHFNSDQTKSIARNLAEELGADFCEYPIEEPFHDEIQALIAITKRVPKGTTPGNVQARIRAMRMWNISNVTNRLWLQTGNMSEKAVGYTTIGGDLMGGYSLIGNLPKTVVIEFTKHLGRKYGIKTVEALSKTRASAELEEDQFDEDQLMPFPVLDLCYLLFVGEMYSPADMYRILRARWTDEELRAMQANFEESMLKKWIEKFVRLFRISIYKWVQSPQAVHIGSLDLDRERALQIPVVHSHEYLEKSIAEMRRL